MRICSCKRFFSFVPLKKRAPDNSGARRYCLDSLRELFLESDAVDFLELFDTLIDDVFAEIEWNHGKVGTCLIPNVFAAWYRVTREIRRMEKKHEFN